MGLTTPPVGSATPLAATPLAPDMGMRHVRVDVQDIYVTPDGRVFTSTGWDEVEGRFPSSRMAS